MPENLTEFERYMVQSMQSMKEELATVKKQNVLAIDLAKKATEESLVAKESLKIIAKIISKDKESKKIDVNKFEEIHYM